MIQRYEISKNAEMELPAGEKDIKESAYVQTRATGWGRLVE